MLFPHWGYGIFGFSPNFAHFHPFSHFFAHLHHIHCFLRGGVRRTHGIFLGYPDPYSYGIPLKAAVMRGDVANPPVLLRKPGQVSKTRFVVWPLELGLGTLNPCFVAWPLELGLGTHNPRFVAWPLELGLGTLNPRFVAWPLEVGLGTCNPRFVAWPLELALGTCNTRFVV